MTKFRIRKVQNSAGPKCHRCCRQAFKAKLCMIARKSLEFHPRSVHIVQRRRIRWKKMDRGKQLGTIDRSIPPRGHVHNALDPFLDLNSPMNFLGGEGRGSEKLPTFEGITRTIEQLRHQRFIPVFFKIVSRSLTSSPVHIRCF